MIELEKIIEIIKSTGVVKDITKYDPEKHFKIMGLIRLIPLLFFGR
ncbi:MAG: hypothetical protein Q3M30_06030 [Candidatus Electrothrix sp. Rat3]|nr:hypothetical protein [Candidatus Electrothrix rattekaaiensis]